MPDTQGKAVDLRVRVYTYQGEKTYTLSYNTDKSRTVGLTLDDADDGISNMSDLD